MSVIIMILLLSVLILVHEAGHFFAAKAFGMKVSKFGFGLPIGPTLWQKQVGDVTVMVHAFLLGGYVEFPDDDKGVDLPQDSPDRFLNRPIYQRAVVVSAGVTANVICALVFVLLTAILCGKLPSGKHNVYVQKVLPTVNKSVVKSGIKDGDQIIRVNGSEINSTYALLMYTRNSRSYDGKADEKFIRFNYAALKLLNPAFVGDEPIPDGIPVLLPKLRKEEALKLPDKILKGFAKYNDNQIVLTPAQKKLIPLIKDKTVIISDGTYSLNDIAAALSDSIKPLNIVVLRDGKEIALGPIYANSDGLIGLELQSQEILIPTTNFKSVVWVSTKYLYDQTYMLIYGLWQICTGKIPLKDLHGIVAITKVGGDVIHNSGFFSGLLLTAVISLDLAIVNFLPIPALDGGHILFLIIEKIRRKPVDEKMVEKIATVGFGLLILLMVIVVFNDIVALVTKQL